MRTHIRRVDARGTDASRWRHRPKLDELVARSIARRIIGRFLEMMRAPMKEMFRFLRATEAFEWMAEGAVSGGAGDGAMRLMVMAESAGRAVAAHRPSLSGHIGDSASRTRPIRLE